MESAMELELELELGLGLGSEVRLDLELEGGLGSDREFEWGMASVKGVSKRVLLGSESRLEWASGLELESR